MRLGVAGAVIGGGYVPGDLEIEDGTLARSGLSPSGEGYAIPGLIDLQVNGYGGVDFNTATHDEFLEALRYLKRDGVFAVQPTIITDDEANVERQLRTLAKVQADPEARCEVVGAHAEGPFLSPSHHGVHRLEYLRRPDQAIIERFMAAGPLRTITIAPELENACAVIKWAARAGLVVQAGHSGADTVEAGAGFDSGACAVTHLFNGMVPFGHRAPGIAGVALTRKDVQLQVIADNVHLSEETVHLILSAAEERCMLVTDASSAAASPSGRGTVGGFELVVTDGVPRLPDGT